MPAALRDWTGISEDMFYDPAQVALMPMGFCYPGTGTSGDLPPRAECAPLWHDRILTVLPPDRLTLLVGTYAQARYLVTARKQSLTDHVRAQDHLQSGLIALPHPSWRSTGWMTKNPWFEGEILPIVRAEVGARLSKPAG
jgi:uracil-DNA glycosylase